MYRFVSIKFQTNYKLIVLITLVKILFLEYHASLEKFATNFFFKHPVRIELSKGQRNRSKKLRNP